MEEATKKAQQEFISSFKCVILPLKSLPNFTTLSIYNINKQYSDGNAYLLAFSVALYQYVIANDSFSSTELQTILDTLASDFSIDGTIDDENLLADLAKAKSQVNADIIEQNLKNHSFANNRIGLDVPEIDKYISQSSDIKTSLCINEDNKIIESPETNTGSNENPDTTNSKNEIFEIELSHLTGELIFHLRDEVIETLSDKDHLYFKENNSTSEYEIANTRIISNIINKKISLTTKKIKPNTTYSFVIATQEEIQLNEFTPTIISTQLKALNLLTSTEERRLCVTQEIPARTPYNQSNTIAQTIHDNTYIEGNIENIQPFYKFNYDQIALQEQYQGWLEDTFYDQRKSVSGGAWEKISPNIISMNYAGTIECISSMIRNKYANLIENKLKRFSGFHIKILDYKTLVYPALYFENLNEVRIPLKHLQITAVDESGKPKTISVFFANYDKINPNNSKIIFKINGHWGNQPSEVGFGMKDAGWLSGVGAAKLAIKGYPIITYDDPGTTHLSSWEEGRPLEQAIESIQVVEEAILQYFKKIDAIGISGGCERLYHYMLIRSIDINSFYCQGYTSAFWARMDSVIGYDGPHKSDSDTHDPDFLNHFSLADMIIAGLSTNILIAIGLNGLESARHKYSLFYEALPIINEFPEAQQLYLRGDTDDDGINDDGEQLTHEWDVHDVIGFWNNL